MENKNLSAAKTAKNDEFYTQYSDIQKEINAYIEYNPDVFKNKTILLPCDDPEWSNFTKFFAQNFATFGLKKLISTSYAVESKTYKYYQPSLFETESPLFDAAKTRIQGKIFTLTADENKDGKIDINDLKWSYMAGDGDFRSAEVKKLRNEADIIITNPPFSLFREFLAWIVEADKKFAIIGNKNAVTYKEVFPLIKENKIWTGKTEWAGGLWFETMNINDVDKIVDGKNMKNSPSVWFTNLDHGRRHQPLSLMTMADNIKFSKHKFRLGFWINIALSSLKLSEQQKAKGKASLPDSGMNQAESHNRLLMENEDTNGSSFVLPKPLFSNTLSLFRHFYSILITRACIAIQKTETDDDYYTEDRHNNKRYL